MSNPNLFDDKYYESMYIVCEQTTPIESKVKILDVKEGDLNFVRFSATLQDFYGNNRNKRRWPASVIKTMSEAKEVTELINKGSFVGEAGHPVPSTGQVTMERIVTIDPLRTSHRITQLSWPKPQELHGIVETLDEGPGSPGYRMMRNILQGIQPAFSLRSIVPQKKNADGTIDVIGPGRMVCYDRVYLPSHQNAYMDAEVPVKNIISKPQFQTVMESYADFVFSHSDKMKYLTDGMDIAMESVTVEPNGIIGVSEITSEGTTRLFIAPEAKYRKEIRGLMRDLRY